LSPSRKDEYQDLPQSQIKVEENSYRVTKEVEQNSFRVQDSQDELFNGYGSHPT
jgi:hypothetical protein